VNKNDNLPDFNRRSFLKNTSLATVMAMMGGVELNAQDAAKSAAPPEPALTKIPVGPAVKYGVIGVGTWGREIVHELSLLPNAPVVAVCDKHKPALRRAAEMAPKAQQFPDYQALLASPDVEAVVIATPTALHREMVEAALKAGKHVYCEAPLATSVDDAKAIAKAAKENPKVLFQPGLQERSHPERKFLLPFIRSGALGENVMVRAQSHQNKVWDTTPWKTDPTTSTGLMGEIGIHQIDAVSWFLREKPKAVTGFGAQIRQNGGGVADTVQGVFDFPGSVRFVYDATLCNSFDKDYEIYYGTQSAIMVRDGKAWMFYEPDAQLGGWEVYAHKDEFYTETGIALAANATKQTAIGTSATASVGFTPLHYALEAFTNNTGQYREAVKGYIDSFGDGDMQGLADSLKTLKPYYPAATWEDGLNATILALKANQAVVEQRKITIEKELFNI
jgi:predicted dehydrogenase